MVVCSLCQIGRTGYHSGREYSPDVVRGGGRLICRYGPEKRFYRVAFIHVPIPTGWASNLTWSDWRQVDQHTCESRRMYDRSTDLIISGQASLAFSTTDGGVGTVDVRQTVVTLPDGTKVIETMTSQSNMIDGGDRRQITAVRWSEVSWQTTFVI